ncbi:glycosyltransferase family 32 protein [Leptodontidium sp. 2 PMI_412]|nr:glycosyltransferase family 32 protein [Leptodontidium sp. 2 PMI_412]
MAPSRFFRHSSCARVVLLLASVILALYCFRTSLKIAWGIVRMPMVWNNRASEFLISNEKDAFDVSFRNYPKEVDTALPGHADLVPPILHHIALSKSSPRANWLDARESCLHYHPGWKSYLWTDESATSFVAEHFPDFKQTWENYRFPIQKIDALRYMVLYQYGGIVLDMDLNCVRSLGPLRRFGFVAPAAHPSGFSVGFIMASRQNPFVGQLVKNLPVYNKNWLGLPYPTVMFSTGCHYASTIHTLQPNRTDLKILAGPETNPNLHSLNGNVVTPLFHHLGSSSWHSYDGRLIVSLGKAEVQMGLLFVAIMLGVAAFLCRKWRRSECGDHLHKPVLLGYAWTTNRAISKGAHAYVSEIV